MRQGYTLKFVNDVTHFNGIAFQKITAGRNIVKKVFYADTRAGRQRFGLLTHDLRTLNLYNRSQFVFHTSAFQLYLRNGGNRRESLSTETHCPDSKYI